MVESPGKDSNAAEPGTVRKPKGYQGCPEGGKWPLQGCKLQRKGEAALKVQAGCFISRLSS